jgi:hypothetical protein
MDNIDLIEKLVRWSFRQPDDVQKEKYKRIKKDNEPTLGILGRIQFNKKKDIPKRRRYKKEFKELLPF